MHELTQTHNLEKMSICEVVSSVLCFSPSACVWCKRHVLVLKLLHSLGPGTPISSNHKKYIVMQLAEPGHYRCITTLLGETDGGELHSV